MEKKKKPKEEKQEKLIDVKINENNQLYVNGKRKLLKDFDHFESQEEVAVGEFDLDGIKKSQQIVRFVDLDAKGSSRFQQRITEGALKELIVSINERGLLKPIAITISKDNEDAYDILDGFTRYLAIETLMDSDKLEDLGFEDFEIKKEFDMETKIPVLLYTKEDGSRIDEEDCYRIASMANTIRAKWNLIDIANAFKTSLRREIHTKIGKKIEENPQVKEHIEVLFENGTPLIILNGLMHANLLKKSDIAFLKEKVFKEMEKDTGLSRSQLRIYSRIAEIPSEYYPVLTGQKNQWGIVISPRSAINLFINSRGQCKSEKQIEKILKQLKSKANPTGKGTKKVSGSQAGELADALTEEGSQKPRKIKSTERNVALMLIEHFAKKGQVSVKELPVILDAYQNSTDLEDFCNTFKEKTGLKLPEVHKFMVDRAVEEE